MKEPRRDPSEETIRVVCQPLRDGFASYRIVHQDESVLWANAYLDSIVARGLSPLTARTYAYAMLAVCRWLLAASLRLEDLAEKHVLELIQFLMSHPSQRRQPLAPRTINLRIVILRSVYSFHYHRELPRRHRADEGKPRPFASRLHPYTGLPQRGPAASSRTRVKVPQELIEALSCQATEQLISSLKTYRDLAIVGLMLFSGLRSGEVLALRLDDLDFDSGVSRVSGKGNKQRVVPLAGTTKSVIRNYLRVERPKTSCKELFVLLKKPRRGCAMTRAGLRSLFRYHRRRANVPQANPHRFRHTFAGDMVRAGCSLPALQRLLGHSHIEVTMRYLHFSTADLQAEYLRAVTRVEQTRRLRGEEGN